MFNGNNIKHWIGVVENKEDKEYRGRVQVRIFGVHTEKKERDETTGEGIPTEDLPWALTSLPLTFGGVSGNGTCPPPAVCVGAWVHGIAFDGDFANQLLVLGVLPNKSNIDPLAKNESGMSIESLLGGLGNSNPSSDLNFDAAPDMQLCDNLTFRQLRDGVIFVESSNGKYLSTKYSSALGWMQVTNSAATHALNTLMKSDSGRQKLEEAGWKFDAEMVNAIKNGDTSNPKYQEYKQMMLQNKEFSVLLGTTYLNYCVQYQGGDPILGMMSYFAGAGNVNKALKELGGGKANLPADVSYDEFLDVMTKYIPGAGSSNATARQYIDRALGPNGAGLGKDPLNQLKNCRGSNSSGHGTEVNTTEKES